MWYNKDKGRFLKPMKFDFARRIAGLVEMREQYLNSQIPPISESALETYKRAYIGGIQNMVFDHVELTDDISKHDWSEDLNAHDNKILEDLLYFKEAVDRLEKAREANLKNAAAGKDADK